jgi:ferric-dicitrate binding protein FerR (iron transport regulator)
MEEPEPNGHGQKWDVAAAWKKVERRIENVVQDERETEHRALFRPLHAFLAVAASLLLLFGVGIFYFARNSGADEVMLANDTTGEKLFTLPDNSTVELSPGSSVEFASEGRLGDRKVTLKGRGAFHVRHNGTDFVVSAAGLQVEVLGTAFTVDVSDPARGSVQVAQGRVRVSAGHDKVVLVRGQRVTLERGKLHLADGGEQPAPQPKWVNFDNVPISEVAGRLEKELHIRIELGAGVKENTITTRVNLSQPGAVLQELSMLCGCKCDTVAPQHYKFYYK